MKGGSKDLWRKVRQKGLYIKSKILFISFCFSLPIGSSLIFHVGHCENFGLRELWG